MILGRVQGTVVSTIKHEKYAQRRLVLLDHIDAAGKELGAYLVAIDSVDADVGQIVLVIDEGNSARQIVDDPAAPIRSVIIGIVDEVQVV
jgi:ethanolamine utilization protein EutN